jgi:hypothetical protein
MLRRKPGSEQEESDSNGDFCYHADEIAEVIARRFVVRHPSHHAAESSDFSEVGGSCREEVPCGRAGSQVRLRYIGVQSGSEARVSNLKPNCWRPSLYLNTDNITCHVDYVSSLQSQIRQRVSYQRGTGTNPLTTEIRTHVNMRTHTHSMS